MKKRSRRPAPPRRRDAAKPVIALSTSKSLDVSVRSTVRRPWIDAAAIRDVAAGAARGEGFRSGQLSIAIVGKAAMTTLHARFSGIATPTDVLTFDLGCDGRTLDGEIIVCADVAEAQRRGVANFGVRRRPAALAELALYVVHGVLHLAGYDDHDESDYARMHEREDAILRRLGWGVVFARDRARAAANAE